MSDADGTFSKLMELADEPEAAPRSKPVAAVGPVPEPAPMPKPVEDIGTTPYISQNYRFTEDELLWLRSRSFELSQQHGAKISQNTILRIALRDLREAIDRNPDSNPLSKAIAKLKK